MLPFVKIPGSTAYCVIYLRIIGILIHILIGTYLYHATKDEIGKKGAFLLTIFHLNFLPKWVCMPEFELMHYWGILLTFLLLYRHEKNGKYLYAVLAGAAYFVTVLCYPSMIILFPLYLIVQRQGKYPIKAPLLFSLGVGIPACFFSGGVISYMTPAEIKEFVGYILMDSSHTGENASYKWLRYLGECLEQLKYIGIGLGIALGVTLVIALIVKFGAKKKLKIRDLSIIAVSVLVFMFCIQTVYGYLLGDQNQFYMQVRFLVLVIAKWNSYTEFCRAWFPCRRFF